jgi:hypothetical protein
MAPLYSELLIQLEKIVQLLLKHGESTWGLAFSELKQKIELGDRQGVITLSQMRGGMGSFFDLAICKINGHIIEQEEEENVNREVETLSAKIFELARQVRTSG